MSRERRLLIFMNMSEWAKREVEIACKKENPNRKLKLIDSSENHLRMKKKLKNFQDGLKSLKKNMKREKLENYEGIIRNE